MKYTNLLYFVLSAFILFFGGKLLLSGEGKTVTNICILLIGLYFLYRGIATTVNARIRRSREEQERTDRENDPENA